MHSTTVVLYSMTPTGTEPQKTCAWSQLLISAKPNTQEVAKEEQQSERQRRGLEEGRERGQEKEKKEITIHILKGHVKEGL